MNNLIKAVIFDMDGVLIEAKDWHYEALNSALSIFGHKISRYDHLNTYDGLPTVMKLEMLSKEKGLPRELHDFINDLKQKFTMEQIFANCKPTFIHEYALAKLKSEGYKIGCASNSIRDSVEVMLNKSNLYKYMDVIFTAQDVDKAKPSPEMYDLTISKLGLTPGQCLIVEDNENGIIAAKASGANVMIVNDVDEVNISNIKNRISSINKLKVKK